MSTFNPETPLKSSTQDKYLTPPLKRSHKPPKTLKHTSLPFFKPPRYPNDDNDQLHLYQQTLLPFNSPSTNNTPESFPKPRDSHTPSSSKPRFILQRNTEPMNPQTSTWRSQRPRPNTSMNDPPMGHGQFPYQPEPKMMGSPGQYMGPVMANPTFFTGPPQFGHAQFQYLDALPMFRKEPQVNQMNHQVNQGKMQGQNKIMRSRFMTKSLPENVKKAGNPGIFRANDHRSKNFHHPGHNNNKNNKPTHGSRNNHGQEPLPEEIRLKIGQPPLEPLSAYQLFVKDKCNELKKGNGNIPHKEALRVANDHWLQDLSLEDKEAYRCKHEECVDAYRKQMNEFRQRKGEIMREYYQNIRQGKNNHNERITMTKEEKLKFKTPFRLFKLDNIVKLKEQHPDITFRERVSMMKDLWKDLSPHAKFLYVQRSRLDKEKYEKIIFGY